MKKLHKNSVSLQEAKRRFSVAGYFDVVFCEPEYYGWKKKSKFFDSVQGEYFWSIPSDVLKHRIVHPKRRQTKRLKNNKKKYGVEHVTQLHVVKEKTKKTNLEKYGVLFTAQSATKKQKTIETNLKKFGFEHHNQNQAIREKTRQTNLLRHGDENPAKVEKFKNKAKQTNLKKYGFENPSQVPEIKRKKEKTSLKNFGVKQPLASQEIRERGKQTLLRKYGVTHPIRNQEIKEKIKKTNLSRYGHEHFFSSSRFENLRKKKVIETGKFVVDWLKEQGDPKPAYSSLIGKIGHTKEVALDFLTDYLEQYRNYKSGLESFSEKVFDAQHFNKSVSSVTGLYRPDFKLSEKVYVNVDGLYWHSEQQKNKNYHFQIREAFECAGIRLLQFREDEIRGKKEIVKSISNNLCEGPQNKLFARKCEVKKVIQKDASSFLNQNHLMGSTNSRHIGLFSNDKLVSIMSYKISKSGVLKIERFCSLLFHTVIGGFSKLLTHLERTFQQEISEIHNWVDLRYGTGIHLLNRGFEKKKETLGWKWTDGKETFNRLQCRANMRRSGLSQKEQASQLGWYKIYDAGQRLYTKSLISSCGQPPNLL